MKYLLRVILSLILLPPGVAAASTPSQTAAISGILQLPSGEHAVNTFVRFELVYCGGNVGRILSGAGIGTIVSFVPFDVHTDATGAYSKAIYGSDLISCGNTIGLSRWRLTPYINGIAGPANTYQFLSDTSFVIDSAPPCTLSVVTNCVSDLRPVAPPPSPIQALAAFTSSIGGSLLSAGSCAVGTATVGGASVGMPVAVSPSDGVLPGGSYKVDASVTASNTVSVEVCSIISGTPDAKTYSVRVIP